MKLAQFWYFGHVLKSLVAKSTTAMNPNPGNEDDVLALFKSEAGAGPVLSGELSKTTFVIANASYSELKWVRKITLMSE